MFQYPWNDNEMFLFKANIAFALRQYYSEMNQTLPFTLVLLSISKHIVLFVFLTLIVVTTPFFACIRRSEHVLIYDVTPRISFNFLVTTIDSNTTYISKSVVEEAVR